MFRACLGPSSGTTTVCIQKLVHIILLEQSTNFCIHMVVLPHNGPRYARNMKILTKYIESCAWSWFFSLHGCYIGWVIEHKIYRT